MDLLSYHDDALFGCVSSFLEGEALSLSRHDDVVGKIEVVVRVTQRAIAAFCERWNSRVGALLPPELLVNCFERLSFNDRLLVSHVSRYWRQVALSTPMLWSAFAVSKQDGKLGEMLRRSQAVPLSLKLLLSPDEETALGPHFVRLRVLQCHNPPSRLDAPLLETLEASRINADEVVLSGDYVGSSAQSLRTLQLRTFSIAPTCPVFRRLRELRANFSPDTSLPRLFALCPALESLTVWCDIRLGRNPRPLFTPLPQRLSEVTVSGLLLQDGPTFDALRPWLNHRFRRLELDRLQNIAGALHLFCQSINEPDSTWFLEILVEGNLIFTLSTAADRTRILVPFYGRVSTVEAIGSLNRFHPHIHRLANLTLSIRLFDICIELGIELNGLTALTIVSDPYRDGDYQFSVPTGSSGMQLPLLSSFKFACSRGQAFRRAAVQWFFVMLPSHLREWVHYNSGKLETVALQGFVAKAVLKKVDHRGSAVYSLAREVHIDDSAGI
ncbi:hypothetical protein AURDEDRAFT_184954 [Auricularia subglabra TFB-10046 SS5]|nr:hypothetical protein AURDEDRAFT_184954 [Auricularia subglabra TFB-10046 SS5]